MRSPPNRRLETHSGILAQSQVSNSIAEQLQLLDFILKSFQVPEESKKQLAVFFKNAIELTTKDAELATKDAEAAVERARSSAELATKDAEAAVERATKDAEAAVERATKDAEAAVERARSSAELATQRSANDLELVRKDLEVMTREKERVSALG